MTDAPKMVRKSRDTNSENRNNVTDGCKNLRSSDNSVIIKEEVEIKIELELKYCLICYAKTDNYVDVFICVLEHSKCLLSNFIANISKIDCEASSLYSKFVCSSCFSLISEIDLAQHNLQKLTDTFVNIIEANPFHNKSKEDNSSYKVKDAPAVLDDVLLDIDVKKTELVPLQQQLDDSDDEPLAKTRKKRQNKAQKPKKQKYAKSSGKCTDQRESAQVNKGLSCLQCKVKFENAAQLGEHVCLSEKTEDRVVVATPSDEKKERSLSPVNNDDDFRNSDSDDDNLLIARTSAKAVDSENDKLVKSKKLVANKKKLVSKKQNTKVLKKNKGIKKVNAESGLAEKKQQNARSCKQKGAKKEPKELLKCTECLSTFSSKVRLDYHMLKHDGSKPPYICEICGAKYKHKRACDIHVAMHQGISPWRCEECDKIFPSKGALQRHIAIHTGKPNYQCDLCGKSFIHTSSFKMHKLSHSGLKPHACGVCGLALMTRSHLKRHQRVHSGEKRHECSVCGKKFSERYNLYAHQKSHEGIAGQMGQRIRTRMHRCNLCENRFDRKYMLEKHLETAHQRITEKGPPKPRNTMTKLLKMQAAAAAAAKSGPAEPEAAKIEISIDNVDVKPVVSSPAGVSEPLKASPCTSPLPRTLTADGPRPTGNPAYPDSMRQTLSTAVSWSGSSPPAYSLPGDYSLRMQGVNYANYIARQ